jgi:MFS family permease
MATTYLQHLRLVRRNAWLVMAAWAAFGFVQRGVYSVIFNLYLLRLGYGAGFIGLVNSAWLLTFALLSLPAGLLARRWGQRTLMVVGKALEAVGFILAALGDLAPPPLRTAWLLASFTLAGVGSATWYPIFRPFLYAATGPEERDHAFAVAMVSNPAAALIGNLAGGVLPGVLAAALGLTLSDAAPYRWVLLLAGLVDLASLVALLATREPQAAPPQAGAAQPRRPTAPERPPWAIVVVLTLSQFLYAAAYGPMMTFLNVYLSDGLGASTALVGGLLAAVRLVSVPVGLTAPLLARRWGHLAASTATLAALTLPLLLLLLVPHWAMVGVAFALALSSYLLMSALLSVYGQELVTPAWRATVSGGMSLAMGLGTGLVSLGGGYAIARWGYGALFGLCALLAMGGAALFWAYFRIPRGELARDAAG